MIYILPVPDSKITCHVPSELDQSLGGPKPNSASSPCCLSGETTRSILILNTLAVLVQLKFPTDSVGGTGFFFFRVSIALMSFSPPEETLSPKLSPMQVEAEDEAQRGSFDYSREPEYDGPEAPPVFVVLESDLASHEIRNSKSSNLKKINPIKNLPRMGASTIRTSKVILIFSFFHPPCLIFLLW